LATNGNHLKDILFPTDTPPIMHANASDVVPCKFQGE